jgi:anti-sigma B factor antagonist
MKILSRRVDDCQVLSVQGSADIDASAVLKEALIGAIEAGNTRIICDLGDTDFICSDALGVLITAYLKARSRGGWVRMADPNERLREVFQTTRLDQLFDVFDDVKQAMTKP